MAPDDPLGLPGEDVRGVAAVVLPGHRHVAPEVVPPALLHTWGGEGDIYTLCDVHSSDAAAVYRLAVIVGVVVVVLLARPVAGVRGEAPVRGRGSGGGAEAVTCGWGCGGRCDDPGATCPPCGRSSPAQPGAAAAGGAAWS